jgi:tetratricopeptide (TPR) repeat protein
MRNTANKLHQIIIIVFILSISSCASFKPGWKNTDVSIKSGDTTLLFKKALELENEASTSSQLKELIYTLKLVVAADPENYEALWRIGNYNMLFAAAYCDNVKDKKYHYREAIQYCEKAMYLNPAFKKKVDNHVKIWDAVNQLDKQYIDAMGYWYTARFYYFNECLSNFGRLFNTKMVIKNNLVIARIDSLNPDWAGGGNYFSRAIYLIAIPEKFGGSKTKAAVEFEKAIKIGPNFLVNRWGRARYLYRLIGNKEGYVNDLKWVIEQNPHSSGNTYPWNVYFQNQAKMMLSEVDKVFK